MEKHHLKKWLNELSLKGIGTKPSRIFKNIALKNRRIFVPN